MYKARQAQNKKMKSQSTITSLFPAVVAMIIRFVKWSMQYNNWQTDYRLTHTDTQTRRHTHTHTHTLTHTIETDILWMLIICLLFHPTCNRRREAWWETQGSRPKWQASSSHNIPFVSLHLHSSHSIVSMLRTFPNESTPFLTYNLRPAARDTQINKDD